MHLVRGQLPGSLTGDKPKQYGTGRKCACGATISRYRKGDQCELCERDPERAARVLEERAREEAEMLGRNKWKSKDYPDGCSACDPDEKFLRRHASGGLCSLHYQRARKEAARLAEQEAAAMRNGDSLDEHLALGGDTLTQPYRMGELDHERGDDAPEFATGGPVLPATIEEKESLLPPQRFGTPAERAGTLEVTSAEPGYPNRADFDDNEEGEKAYQYACETFEGDTHTVSVVRCCGEGEACASETCSGTPVRADVEPMQCCGQRPEGDADCTNCPLDDQPEAPQDEYPYATKYDDLLHQAWGVIANANLDDWNDDSGKDKTEWRVAAERWRDEYHAYLGDQPEDAPAEEGPSHLERAIIAAERAVHGFALQSELTQRATELAARAIAYKVNLDPEARAIEAVAKAMEGLDVDARNRVSDYVYARFYTDK